MAKHLLISLLLGIAYWLAASVHAADDKTINREFQLKTAYLFHFAELAEWPTAKPVNICLSGSSPLRVYLPILEGQIINGKAVHVSLDEQMSPDQCQIVFLSDLSMLSRSLRDQAKRNHVLLVSDIDGFAEQGGMVEFTLRDNKLKLVVNLGAVKDAGIKLSSKLLRMAEILE